MPVRDQQRLIIAWKDLKASGYQHYPFGDRAITGVTERSQLLERVAGVTTNGVSHWIAVDDGVAAYVRGALVTDLWIGDAADPPPDGAIALVQQERPDAGEHGLDHADAEVTEDGALKLLGRDTGELRLPMCAMDAAVRKRVAKLPNWARMRSSCSPKVPPRARRRGPVVLEDHEVRRHRDTAEHEVRHEQPPRGGSAEHRGMDVREIGRK